MRTVRVRSTNAYTRLYPRADADEAVDSAVEWKNFYLRVMRPKGYAGRPMSLERCAGKI